jgi:hypothetical protein
MKHIYGTASEYSQSQINTSLCIWHTSSQQDLCNRMGALQQMGTDAGLSPQRPVFMPRWVHVGFVMDKVALRQVFLQVLWFNTVNIIPPLLHTHLSPPYEVCNSPDQAAHYHTLGHKLGASSLTRHLAGKTGNNNLFHL